MTKVPRTSLEIIYTVVAAASGLVVIGSLLLMVFTDSGNWFTVVGASVGAAGAIVAVASLRRARKKAEHASRSESGQ